MSNRLQFEIGFEEDPDNGVAASLEESASWGWFKITVDGVNLCQYVANSELSDRVSWYLLPMLEWFVGNWDSLLHEIKMPSAFADAISARHGFRSFNPYKNIDDDDIGLSERYSEHEEVRVFEWAERHALRTSADGGIFPDVFLRRFRNEIELSWGHSRVEGAPSDLRFVAPPGQTYLDPREVASVLFDSLCTAIRSLCERHPLSARLKSLHAALRALEQPRSVERAAWMAGLGESVESSRIVLENLTKNIKQTYQNLIVPMKEPLIISRAPAAVLMFGSLSPRVSQQDVDTLLRLLEDAATKGASGTELPKIDVLPSSARPHEQGYELATLAHETMQLPAKPLKLDIQKLLSRYGVAQREVDLSDTKIRAIAICGKDLQALVVVNRSCRHNHTEPGLRFTLAHELCHLLFDEEDGVPLAVASGPWAAATIEKRANAFAAMFLMPEEACRLLLNTHYNAGGMTTTVIAEIATAFGTGKLATLRHLSNLDLIDGTEAEDLAEQFVN
jgi:Zn-dependent peptidase ImmA (M78 family)